MDEKYLLTLLFLWLAFASVIDFDPTFRLLKPWNLLLSGALFILISGLRVDVPDLETYRLIFEDIRTGRDTDRSGSMELIYWHLNWIFSSLFGEAGFRALILFVSAATFLINFHVIRRISPYPFVSLAFYSAGPFWGKDLTQLRAGLAAALIMLALYFFALNRKRIQSYSTLLLATLVHVSGVVALAPFLSFRLVSLWFVALSITGLLLLMILGFPTSTVLLDALPFQMPPIIQQYKTIPTQSGSLDILSLRLLSQLTIFVFLFFHRRTVTDLFPHAQLFIYVYGMSLILYLFFYDFSILGTRLSSIVSNVEMILIAIIPMIGQRVYRLHGLFAVLVICFCGLTFLSNLLSDKIPIYRNLLF